jgi:hypothetical protein
MRKTMMVGTACVFGVALIVGLSAGLTEHHESSSSSSPMVICGGGEPSGSQKLACYPTTASSGIKVNSDIANQKAANSFCQSKLASGLLCISAAAVL